MTHDNDSADAKRRRGIQASPAKLRKALADSNLRTQSALAERMADLEQLDAPPRGLVNRVFKGEAVDPQSLERVARALNVPGWSLYRSSDEPAEAADNEDDSTASPLALTEVESAPEPSRRRWSNAWIGIGLAVLTAIGLWQWFGRSTVPTSVVAMKTNLSAAVLPIAGARGADLQAALSRALDRHWRVLPMPKDLLNGDPQQLLARREVERVVEARAVDSGRWVGLVLYVHEPGSMREVWMGANRLSASESTLTNWLRPAAEALALEVAPPDGATSREALDRYLDARRNVDSANTELHTRRALTDFGSAVRLAPGFVDAYAGLCEALVLENVRTGDAGRLVEAARECNRAIAFDANNLEARRSLAYLDRKRGNLDAARRGFESVLKNAPDNVDALIGLAEVHLTRYSRGEDAKAIEIARQQAERAAELEPRNWKAPFSLARIHYMASRLPQAIDANNRAAELDPNLPVLSNLGTFQFCAGDLAAARTAYLRAQETNPDAFVGDGQLGVVEFFLRDYTAAVAHLKRAIELHERSGKAGEHRLWGNYADALRRSGDRAAAIDAYARAIALAERDAAGGDRNPVHESYLVFYYEMLDRLEPKRWSNKIATTEKLRELATGNDPMSLMYIAAVYFQRGQDGAAMELRKKAAPACPGYEKSPDLQLR